MNISKFGFNWVSGIRKKIKMLTSKTDNADDEKMDSK